jgi:hypothetical protein
LSEYTDYNKTQPITSDFDAMMQKYMKGKDDV